MNTKNQIYSRDCDKRFLYYESIRVKVNTSGDYSFLSHSIIDAFGLIYKNEFDPLNPLENLLGTADSDNSDLQYRLNIRLSGDMTYVLVVTTYPFKETGVIVVETGVFSIVVLGNNKVILERLSKYIL